MKCRGMTVTISRNHQTYRNPLSAVLTICALVLAVAMVATNPAWAQTYSVIHEFTSGAGGANPQAGMVMDHGGNLYGTTIAGGGGTCPNFFGQPGCGTVFKLSRPHRETDIGPKPCYTGSWVTQAMAVSLQPDWPSARTALSTE